MATLSPATELRSCRRKGMNNNSGKKTLLSGVLKDLVKALLIGIIAGGAVTLVFFLAGLAFGGSGSASGIETSKNVLFLCTAVLMFILAGMLLIKGKKPEKSYEESGWRRHFSVIGPKSVLGAIAAAFAIWAIVMDYIQFSLK